HNVITSAALGSTVHDSATVSGKIDGIAITGNVTLTFYTAASDSTGASTGAGTVDLVVSRVAHPSAAFGASAAGSYSFHVTQSSDAHYRASTRSCESLTHNNALSSSPTRRSADQHNVITSAGLGSTVHDSATVTGIAAFTPTGNVTFTFYT